MSLDILASDEDPGSIRRLSYSLPKDGQVRLAVFDVSGRKIADLVNEALPGGTHLAEWDTSGHPNGVYFYRLEAGYQVMTQKMVLLR